MSSLEKALSTLLIHSAKFRRLPEVIQSVWQLLPENDKMYISENVYFTVHEPEHPGFPDHLDAGTAWVSDSSSYTGKFRSQRLSIDGLAGTYYRVSFKDDLDELESYSMQKLGDIVAHEFAHVVLRHGQFILSMIENGVATWDALDRRLELAIELSADSQVLNWRLDEGVVLPGQARMRIETKSKFDRNFCHITRRDCVIPPLDIPKQKRVE